MATDGGLRKLVRKHLIDFHWQTIETGGTGNGVPDDNFCREGIEGWVEHKAAASLTIPSWQPEQPGWILRRRRAGGRVFVMVRRQHDGGPRLGKPVDEVYLYPGDVVKELMKPQALGALGPKPLIVGVGGSDKWPWEEIRKILLHYAFLSSAG